MRVSLSHQLKQEMERSQIGRKILLGEEAAMPLAMLPASELMVQLMTMMKQHQLLMLLPPSSTMLSRPTLLLL
jgi:hypothetical protein